MRDGDAVGSLDRHRQWQRDPQALGRLLEGYAAMDQQTNAGDAPVLPRVKCPDNSLPILRQAHLIRIQGLPLASEAEVLCRPVDRGLLEAGGGLHCGRALAGHQVLDNIPYRYVVRKLVIPNGGMKSIMDAANTATVACPAAMRTSATSLPTHFIRVVTLLGVTPLRDPAL